MRKQRLIISFAKRIIVFVIIGLMIKCASEPTVDKLDEKYGFKKFRFGEDIAKYKEDLKYTHLKRDNSRFKIYKYVGDDYTGLFGVDWQSLELEFCQDKLVNVKVHFESNDNQYNHLLNGLQKTFGNAEIIEKRDFLNSKLYTWNGEKVFMSFGFDEDKSMDYQYDFNSKGELEAVLTYDALIIIKDLTYSINDPIDDF